MSRRIDSIKSELDGYRLVKRHGPGVVQVRSRGFACWLVNDDLDDDEMNDLGNWERWLAHQLDGGLSGGEVWEFQEPGGGRRYLSFGGERVEVTDGIEPAKLSDFVEFRLDDWVVTRACTDKMVASVLLRLDRFSEDNAVGYQVEALRERLEGSLPDAGFLPEASRRAFGLEHKDGGKMWIGFRPGWVEVGLGIEGDE